MLVLENLLNVKQSFVIQFLLIVALSQEHNPADLEQKTAISSLLSVRCIEGHDGLEASVKVDLVFRCGLLPCILLDGQVHRSNHLIKFVKQFLNEHGGAKLKLAEIVEHIHNFHMIELTIIEKMN